MGVVTVTGLTVGNFVTAVSTGPVAGTGDPGCATTNTYTFPKLTATSQTIALPFGAWKIYTGTTSGSTTTQILTTKMTIVSRATKTTTGNILTLDPRQ